MKAGIKCDCGYELIVQDDIIICQNCKKQVKPRGDIN